MSHKEFLAQETQEQTAGYTEHPSTLPGVLIKLTDQVTELGILPEATERVELIHQAHKDTVPEGELDPMYIAFADAAIVAHSELQKGDDADPSAVIKALHSHLSLRNKARLTARKLLKAFSPSSASR